MQETQIPSLGQEDPLEEGMATHSSILAWRIPWTEEPGGLQSMGLQESDMTELTKAPLPCYQNVSLLAQWQRIRQPMQETWVQSLGLEDPLEKKMETHSSVLAWKIPWTEEPDRLPSTGSQR